MNLSQVRQVRVLLAGLPLSQMHSLPQCALPPEVSHRRMQCAGSSLQGAKTWSACALRCAAQADGQTQACGGAMGPLPGASRSTGSLSGSSLRWGRGGVGCFQMSGSCSRG